MLFYSTTIEKLQGYLDFEDITPAEYANYMVEEMESLIVKVGKVLSDTDILDLRYNVPGE